MKVGRGFQTQQPHGADLAVRGGFDALGELDGASLPPKGTINSGKVDSTGISEGFSGMVRGEVDSGAHGSNIRTACEESKGEVSCLCEIAKNAKFNHPLMMSRKRLARPDDPWPQRLYVIGLIDGEVAKGATYESLAQEFELDTPYSLVTGWRYNYDRVPHRITIEKIAKHFNLPARKIFDASPPSGPPSELDLATQMIEGAMGPEVLTQISDEQKISAYRAAIAMARSVLAR